MSERLCVVMPVYNERDAIGAVLERWDTELRRLGIDYEIRPYNDGSRDDSLEVMRRVASRLRKVNVRDKPNGGHGNTILIGYREAADDGFDWIFQIDSDDEMGPEKFGELWAKRGDYDFLVGTRDGRKQALPRKVVSLVSRLCVRLFYGKSVWDVNTPYRLMRVAAFKSLFASIPLDTFAPNVVLSGFAARDRLRSFEMRVPQHDRTSDEVSIKKWKLFKAAAKSFWQTELSFALPSASKRQSGSKMLFGGLIAMLALSSFIVADNPLCRYMPQDSAIFAYIGKAIASGRVPYRDLFDQKGPLLYFINYAGVMLGGGGGMDTDRFVSPRVRPVSLSVSAEGVSRQCRIRGADGLCFDVGLPG